MLYASISMVTPDLKSMVKWSSKTVIFVISRLASVLITPVSANYAGSKTARFTIGKGKTTFKVKASKKKIKVTSLSKGASKVRFSVKKVTNGQKSKVKINSRTGKITLKKKIKKCTIYVKATSKANKNRKAGTKTVKIVVR